MEFEHRIDTSGLFRKGPTVLCVSETRMAELLAAESRASAAEQANTALREALEALVDNAGGYDKSIVRALAIRALNSVPKASSTADLARRVMAAEEAGRAALAAAAPARAQAETEES